MDKGFLIWPKSKENLMADLSKEQKNLARELVEEFRDAAFKQMDTDRGLPSAEDVQTFVALDTWIKLDDAEQEKNGWRKPRFIPGRR